MAAQMCDVCGIRPAVATVRRRGPDGEVVEQRLCRVHLAEVERETASPFSGLGGRGGLFDELFSAFFERGAGGALPTGGGGTATRPRRGVEQVDITEFFSDATRE